MSLENDIQAVVQQEIRRLNRPDLFRDPMVSFSSAQDRRYAELKTIIGDWHLLPNELLPSAKTVISYCVPFTEAVANAPKETPGETYIWGEAYGVINSYFAHINERLCRFLADQGFKATPIPATHTYDPIDMKCKWSHRSAAVIAGLGTLGANRLVITKKGSAVRFCTVITSAPLTPAETQAEDRCLYHKDGSCGLCFAVCPPKALHQDGFDKFACQQVCDINGQQLAKTHALPEADTCGKCISVCPYAYIA